MLCEFSLLRQAALRPGDSGRLAGWPAAAQLDLQITRDWTRDQQHVEDDGEGIPPEVTPNLFELFTRGERTAATPGLGIGLSVVKRLAELHGGFVEGRSVGRGNGGTFTLRLPRAPRQGTPSPGGGST